MEHKRKKKIIALFILFFIVQPLLMGSGLFEVKLRNTSNDDRLVNIDELIGGNNMPDSSETPETEEAEPEEMTETDEKTETTSSANSEPEDKEIIVSICEKTILINGIPAGSGVFEEKFSRIYDGSQEVVLEDNYAEYHTYNDVKSYFDKNQIKYRVNKI